MTKSHCYRIVNYRINFATLPSKKFVETLLEVVYGIKHWSTAYSINKVDHQDIPDKLVEFLPFLSEYLRPCVIKKYFFSFYKINFNRCVTLLHQFLLAVGWNLRSESIVEYHEYTVHFKYQKYFIYCLDENPISGVKIQRHVILRFD
jgi:hypothetical protein